MLQNIPHGDYIILFARGQIAENSSKPKSSSKPTKSRAKKNADVEELKEQMRLMMMAQMANGGRSAPQDEDEDDEAQEASGDEADYAEGGPKATREEIAARFALKSLGRGKKALASRNGSGKY